MSGAHAYCAEPNSNYSHAKGGIPCKNEEIAWAAAEGVRHLPFSLRNQWSQSEPVSRHRLPFSM
jgi:hypothetical protein